jgi:Protein of unknown function (DUF1488)
VRPHDTVSLGALTPHVTRCRTRDADDSIVFWGNDGDTRVRFRISREALADHFSEDDRLRSDAAFKKHRHEIEGIARRKYLLGRKEADATVLIKTLDIAG